MSLFTAEELAELAAADAEIEANFEESAEEVQAANARDWNARTKAQQRQAVYNALHRAERTAYHREYVAAHREEIAAYRHAHYVANKDHIIAQNRIRRQRKRAAAEAAALSHNIRG